MSSTNRLQNWDYKSALKHLQTRFGVFPYYRVSVENSYTMPYDYIITLDEGELGLPDKYFYAAHADEEVVRGYKLLLRDFAINMGKSCEPRDLRFDLIKSTYFPLPCQASFPARRISLPMTFSTTSDALSITWSRPRQQQAAEANVR